MTAFTRARDSLPPEDAVNTTLVDAGRDSETDVQLTPLAGEREDRSQQKRRVRICRAHLSCLCIGR